MTRLDVIRRQAELYPVYLSDGSVNPDAPGRTLPEICVDVHAAIVGMSEPMEPGRMVDVLGMLRETLRTWRYPQSAFDSCVRNLVAVVVQLLAAELEKENNTIGAGI
jgi:hypothetical protein